MREDSKLVKAISCLIIFALVLSQCPYDARADETFAPASQGEEVSAPTTEANSGEAPEAPPELAAMSAPSTSGASSAALSPFQSAFYRTDLLTGTAALAIPIVVPPGRKGIQPNLGLSYSSSGSNGICGVGWQLELGSIQRNTKKGIPQYDSTDSFAANLSGANIELVDIGGNEYRAKQEGAFLKFSFDGTSWQVKDKSGTTYSFGASENSRQEDAGRIFSWHLDKIIDLHGNYLTLSYLKDQNQIYPQEIQYTGKEGADAPTNLVEFIYEPRDDVISNYRAHFEVTTAKRLAAIQTQTNGQDVAKFVLGYTESPDTSRSLLTSLTQLSGDSQIAFAPLTFSYQHAQTSFTAAKDFYLDTRLPILGDFNGDGLMDAGRYLRNVGYWQVRLAESGGGFSREEVWLINFGTNNEWQPLLGDFNGDAKTDIAIFNQNSGECQVAVSDGRKFVEQGTWANLTGGAENLVAISGDFNGDGVTDIGAYNKTNGEVKIGITSKGTVSSTGLDYYTKLLLHFNGEDGPAFLDSSLFAHSVRALGTAQVDTQEKLFGVASAFFDGAGDYLTTADSEDWNFDSGDFTIDVWVKYRASPITGPNLVCTETVPGDFSWFLIPYTNSFYFGYSTSGSDWNSLQTPYTFSTGQWYHLAVARSGDTLMAFVNGRLIKTKTETRSLHNSSHYLSIGGEEGGGYLNGWLDELRISKGIARWSADFTPPNSEYHIGEVAGSESETWISGLPSSDQVQPFSGDFNGDGLTDLALYNGNDGQWHFAFSDGTKFLKKFEWSCKPVAGQILIISDFTNDGLTDIGLFHSYSNRWQVFRSTEGSALVEIPVWLSDFGQGRDTLNCYALDFNGDGLTDPIMLADVDGNWERMLTQGNLPDLLQGFTNPLGGTSEITYTPSTQYDNTGADERCDLPFPIQTVSQVKQDDGQGNFYQTTYTYADGLYVPQERETRGFGFVKVTDAAGNTNETYFHQDNIFKGLPYKSQVRDSRGELYLETNKTYDETSPYSGSTFAYLREETSSTYDGQITPRTTGATYEYDEYANPTKITNLGDIEIAGDEKESNIKYVYNPELWLLGLPAHTSLKDARGKVQAASWSYYDGHASYLAPPTKGLLSKEERWLNSAGRKSNILIAQYNYDEYGNLVSSTDARGNTTTTTYDEAYHTYPQTITNALGQTVQYTYDPRTGQVLTSTDPNHQTTRNEYDSFGRLIKVFGPNDDPEHPGSWYEYDLEQQPVKITSYTREEYNTDDPNKIRTTYSFYDGLGRLIQTKSEAEDSTQQIISGTAILDSRGQVKEKYLPYYIEAATQDEKENYSASDYSGPKVSFEYDPLGRVTNTTSLNESSEEINSTVQYAPGQKTTTDANGHQTRYTSDAYGQLIKVEEFNQEEIYTTKYTYDAQGNLIQTLDNQGNITKIQYDSWGRKISMDDPDMGRWQYQYDLNGNLIRQTDAKGQIIKFEYDALNRLTQKIINPSTSPPPATPPPSTPPSTPPPTSPPPTSPSPTSPPPTSPPPTSPPPATANPYNPLSPPYNPLSNPSGPLSAHPITYIYDNTSKPNCIGRLSKITDSSGSTEFFYDNLGREIKTIKTVNNAPSNPLSTPSNPLSNPYNPLSSYTINRTYDALDRLTSLTYPDGEIVQYKYNPQGIERVFSINYKPSTINYISNIDYTATSQISKIQYSNGITTEYNYNPRTLRLTHLQTESPSTKLQDLTYSFDNVGNVQTISDNSPSGTNTQAFQYDDLNRLIQAQGSYGTLNYQYDSIGNMLQNANLSMEYGQGPAGPHALTRISDQTGITNLTYDKNGNLLTKGNTKYQYDGENRLIKVTAGRTQTEFLYDGDGGRVKKTTVSGTKTPPTSSGQVPDTVYAKREAIYIGSLFEVTRQTGSTNQTSQTAKTTIHIFLGANRAFSLETYSSHPPLRNPLKPKTLFYHQDHIGSSNVISDETGKLVQLLEYTPYGLTNRQEGSYNSDYRFTGKLFDNSSGLYFYGARYYDPELGRFTQADTIIQDPYDPQSLNRYSYCRNNPINYVDPSGHGWFSKFWRSIVSVVTTVVSIAVPVLAPAMMAVNFAISTYTAVQSGNILGLAGGIVGGAVFGAIGKSLALGMAARMGASAFTFGGGALIGAVEFGMAGFGAGLGGGLASGASFSEALGYGGRGAAVGAVSGAIIEGSYMAGWQNTLHGASKQEIAQSRAAYEAKVGEVNRVSALKGTTDIYGENQYATGEISGSALEFETESPYTKASISLDKATASAKLGASKDGFFGAAIDLSAEVINASNEIKLFSVGDTAFSLHYDLGWGAQAKGALVVDQSGGKFGVGLGWGPTFGAELRYRNINRW